MPNEVKILTVTQLNDYVKMLLDGNPVLSRVWVRGEISNLTFHSSGHLYFSLKDETARAAAVMFRTSAEKLKFRPANGMRVLAAGRISLYPRDGVYQIYVSSLEPDGVGALAIAYGQLRRKLEAEGLFREEIKKPLPRIPRTVGVVTSPTGAAIRDILNITGRRFPAAKVVLYPAQVQGEGAESDLIAGIEALNRTGEADVIIIGRGGGSIEDLWAFNSEALARAIRNSRIPVISAVGHETDFTICDFAADRRAPTPSAAAELAVPDTQELKRKLDHVIQRITAVLQTRIGAWRKQIGQLSIRRVLLSPTASLDDRRMRLATVSETLERIMRFRTAEKKQTLQKLSSVLAAVSPLKLMARGYAAVFSDRGDPVRSVRDVSVGERISFRVADGAIDASVIYSIPNLEGKTNHE